MPLGSVAQGTKEVFQYIAVDRDNAIVNLATANPKFDVLDFNEAYKYGDGTYLNAQAATAAGMKVSCLVDTNVGGIWPEGDYRLFVWFVIGSETIRKGPFFFQVTE